MIVRTVAALSLLALGACTTANPPSATAPTPIPPSATAATAASYAKPGFVTEVKDGRLWVFRPGSKDLEEFRQHGELTKMVTRIGAGPQGMTIRAADAKDIDDYLAAR